jgi:hypothetical protein
MGSRGKGRADVAFAMGELVLLSTKNLKLKGSSPRKLLPRYLGPFKVLATIGKVAYRLELPETMRIHNVFHASLLQKYTEGRGTRTPPPVPEVVDGELEYTVSSITAHRVTEVGGKRKNAKRIKVDFLTCWTGYGREHDSWEPGEMLKDTEALEIYLQRLVQRKEPLPPGYLPEKAAEPPTAKRGRSRSPGRGSVPDKTDKRLKAVVARDARQEEHAIAMEALHAPEEDDEEHREAARTAVFAEKARRRRVRFQLE